MTYNTCFPIHQSFQFFGNGMLSNTRPAIDVNNRIRHLDDFRIGMFWLQKINSDGVGSTWGYIHVSKRLRLCCGEDNGPEWEDRYDSCIDDSPAGIRVMLFTATHPTFAASNHETDNMKQQKASSGQYLLTMLMCSLAAILGSHS